jgi:ABC-type sugar transport system ATPase subunit
MLSEDRAGEGLALGLSVADNLTCSRLDELGPGFLVLPSRQAAAAKRWIDRLAIRCTGSRQIVGQLSGGNQQKVAVARLLHHDVDVLILDEPTRGIDVASKAQIYEVIDRLVSAGPEGLALHNRGPEGRPLHDGRRDGRTMRAPQPVPGQTGAVRDGLQTGGVRDGLQTDPSGTGEGSPGGGGQTVPRKAVLLVSSYLPELLGVCDRIAVMSRGRLGPARKVSEWNEHSLLMEASGARAAS